MVHVRTVEARYNKGPKDWQNVLAKQTSRHMILGSFFIYLAITGAKNIYRPLYPGHCYKEVR